MVWGAENSAFDRWIWRINGTLLLLLALLGAGLAFFGFRTLGNRTERTVDVEEPRPGAGEPAKLRIGHFQALKGTDYFVAPLREVRRGFERISYKGHQEPARNYLFFDGTSREGRWIWNDNSSLVLDDTHVLDGPEGGASSRVVGLAFQRVSADSDGDGRISEQDLRAVEYFDLASGKLLTIAEAIDHSIDVRPFRGNELLVFFAQSGKSMVLTLNTKTLAVSPAKEVIPK